MTTEKGFCIRVRSGYEGWWRYNVALMCGCFDASDQRTDFASARSHVADVGANLAAKPSDIAGDRCAELTTPPCDHLILYVYIIPHTLPAECGIEDTKPFEIEIEILYGGKKLRTERHRINQWSGASLEMRIDRQ